MVEQKPSKIVIIVVSLAILAGFIYGMVALFSTTKTQLLEYSPPPREENAGSNLIWYKKGTYADIKHWVVSLNELIKPYEFEFRYEGLRSGIVIKECYDGHLANPEEGEVCKFDYQSLGTHCTTAEGWGYKRGSPCVILKMSKMIGWVPEVYNKTDVDGLLPYNMPGDLKDHIMRATVDNGGTPPAMVWVSCDGEKQDDREHLGYLEYTPWQGFPAYYFPFMDTPEYLPPLVAVRMIDPAPNVTISIQCKLWAKNIVNSTDTSGVLNFELLIN